MKRAQACGGWRLKVRSSSPKRRRHEHRRHDAEYPHCIRTMGSGGTGCVRQPGRARRGRSASRIGGIARGCARRRVCRRPGGRARGRGTSLRSHEATGRELFLDARQPRFPPRRHGAGTGARRGPTGGGGRVGGTAGTHPRRGQHGAEADGGNQPRGASAVESGRRRTGAPSSRPGARQEPSAHRRGRAHRTRRLPDRDLAGRPRRHAAGTLAPGGAGARQQPELDRVMDRTVRLREYLADCRRAVSWATPIATSGRLTRVSGLVMEAVGLRMPVGSQCHIQIPGGQSIEAEVAGFAGDRLFIMPAPDIYGVMPGARVVPDNPLAAQPPRLGRRYIPRRRAQDRVRQVPVGDTLLGRVLDGAGRPLDGLGPLMLERRVPLYSRPITPLERAPIRQPLDVGVRAITGLLTVGRGQRLGLFSGSGSITAFFTVLMEGDDQQVPIADAARAILDGHIVLSRELADAGHYPAIDIEASISRAQPDLLSDEALERTRRFKYLYSRYMRSRDLLAVGAYVPGADLVLDEGVRLYPRMQGYLMQGMREPARFP